MANRHPDLVDKRCRWFGTMQILTRSLAPVVIFSALSMGLRRLCEIYLRQLMATLLRQTRLARRLVTTNSSLPIPPYYDNIGYADLSDFFYVWLRRSLEAVFPDLFATLAVPKAEELVATPYRHGGKEEAERFFLKGMTLAMQRLAGQSHPGSPTTIYYAFKQSETRNDIGTASTGWETFLEAVIRAGFSVTGTWPMRTENTTRTRWYVH